jgi:hypothetical protein
MKTLSIPAAVFYQSARWDPRSLIAKSQESSNSKHTPLSALRNFVTERKLSGLPPTENDSSFNYLGLENVEPFSGDLVGTLQKVAGDVKSRCKIYRTGDILFGRLRPNLAKVFYCAQPDQEGYCSTEFIVLQPRNQAVRGRVIRQLLASARIADHLSQLVAGAALPRVSAETILEINIPKLNEEKSKQLDQMLQQAEVERALAKHLIKDQPKRLEELLWDQLR